MFIVRPYTATDYDDFARIDAATLSTAIWSESDWHTIHPPCDDSPEAKRYVALETASSKIVGYGAVMLTEPSNFDVIVDPAWQRRGIGKTLWEHMGRDLSAFGTATVSPWIRVANVAGCFFAESLGFTVVSEAGAVQLFLSSVDLARFAPATGRLAQQGIQLTTLAAEKENPDHIARFYELFAEVEKDVPGYLPGNRTTYEGCIAELEQPGMSPETVFLAKKGGAYVGLSIIGRRVSAGDVRFAGGTNCISQHLTGVHPFYRRRGIASALKVHALRYAKERGYERILSNSDNPAMRGLNRKLGFRVGPWLIYSKRLR